MDKVDIWGVESRLYAYIDANGIRGNSRFENKFCIGGQYFVDVRIDNFSKNFLSNHSLVETSIFVFSLNFRKGEMPWFRVDNESKDKKEIDNYLHFHLESKEKPFEAHQKLEEKYTVSELVSFTFEWMRKILKEKFPEETIEDSSGFVGFG
jgi:hypothetical protein